MGMGVTLQTGACREVGVQTPDRRQGPGCGVCPDLDSCALMDTELNGLLI